MKKPKKVKKLSETKTDDSDEETNVNPPKGRILDLNEIRSELKGINKVKQLTNNPDSGTTTEKETTSSDESTSIIESKYVTPIEEVETEKKEKIVEKSSTTSTTTTTVTATTSSSSDDIYEFKEPEPFEFETRKVADDKNKKRLVPRVLDDSDKSPKKKIIKSPIKIESKETPEDKKRFRKSPIKKLDEDVNLAKEAEKAKLIDDAFDKLVESPSFVHVGNKLVDAKKACKNLNDELPLFTDLPEYDVKLDILDEPLNEPFFSNKQQLFTDSNFAKAPDVIENECMAFAKAEEIKKDSDDEDHIRASIQRVIAQTSLTDDDSSDCTLNQPLLEYCSKKNEKTLVEEPEQKVEVPKVEEKEDKEVPKQLTPVFQGSDSNLLEQICTPQPPVKTDEFKDINVKAGGTKIADTILQRFNLIKTKIEPMDVKIDETIEKVTDTKLEISNQSNQNESIEYKTKEEITTTIKEETATENVMEKKRLQRKVINKFLESDTDSDSEERLVIHSDDSQTFDDNKPTTEEETDKNIIAETKPKEERNFNIEEIKTSPMKEETIETEQIKEEEPDSHIHSLLLCQETIPGSPAPSVSETKPKPKAISEMPFASAPSSSNKSLLNNDIKPAKIERIPSPVIVHQVEMKHETSTVLDNTPPTTPESTISNLSPRA